MPAPTPPFAIRLARPDDVASLHALIPLSARALQRGYYTDAQIEAALGTVFGVDSQLIADRTYYVAESADVIVGCGGWSRRRTLFGGDRAVAREDALLDPTRDPARIRAFFVHPDHARRGIGRSIMETCDAAARRAGFRAIEIVATLAGRPLYETFGYTVVETFDIPLPGGIALPALRMAKPAEERGRG